jgi:hypothetical protein
MDLNLCPDNGTPTVLNGTVGWQIKDGNLVVTKAGVGELVYVPIDTSAQDPNKLLGVTWTLFEIGSSGSHASHRAGGVTTVTFRDGPAFIVHYQCVTESGQVETVNGTLVLDVKDSSDAKPCSSAASEQDNQVRERLTGDLRWIIAGDRLTITSSAGTLTFIG